MPVTRRLPEQRQDAPPDNAQEQNPKKSKREPTASTTGSDNVNPDSNLGGQVDTYA
jgi:hypothetical protein